MLKASKKRRFIAGAVCPACKQQDKLVLFLDENDNNVFECVSCGHSETLPEDLNQESQSPAAPNAEVEAQAVKFVEVK